MGCVLPFDLVTLRIGFVGSLSLFVVREDGLSSVEAWFFTALDIEEVLVGAGGVISCMSWLLISSSPLTQSMRLFWIVPWCVLVCLLGSGKSTSYHSRFTLAAGLGEPGCPWDGVHCSLVCPLV